MAEAKRPDFAALGPISTPDRSGGALSVGR